jgi:lipid II:glycine glycyltransferase (peptidoglycan interpeptide bridge formation enzyme)
MAVSLEIIKTPDENWDKRVEKGEGDIYQTTIYAKFQEDCLGMNTDYLLVRDEGGNVVGQLMLTSGPRFAKYLNKERPRLKRFFEKHFMVYTSIRGPVILKQERKKEIYEIILDKIEELAKKNYAVKDFSLPVREDKEIYELFLKRGFYSDDWGTVVVDTTQPVEKLWANLQKSRRNIVRGGEKQGLSVRKAKNEEDYKKAYTLLKEMSDRNNVFCHSLEYYIKFFSIFNNQNEGGIFLVEKDNLPLATITLYVFNDKAAQTAVAYSSKCLSEKISATDFIEWFLIKYCHDNQIKSYDLAGIRPNSKDKKTINLMEFKLRWGGEKIDYPYFSKEYSLWKKTFIKLLQKTVKKKYQRK